VHKRVIGSQFQTRPAVRHNNNEARAKVLARAN
jgi:hypothetical protein